MQGREMHKEKKGLRDRSGRSDHPASRSTAPATPSSHPDRAPPRTVRVPPEPPRLLVDQPQDARGILQPPPSALVAQRIEHRPPEPCAQVRVLPRARNPMLRASAPPTSPVCAGSSPAEGAKP